VFFNPGPVLVAAVTYSAPPLLRDMINVSSDGRAQKVCPHGGKMVREETGTTRL
jgi:hypothetical protein